MRCCLVVCQDAEPQLPYLFILRQWQEKYVAKKAEFALCIFRFGESFCLSA